MKKLFSLFLSLAVACCSPAYAGSLNNINPISLVYATGTLGIAHGGTNGTSFLAPSGGCDPITFFDGTRINTNSVVTDLCYNPTTNTVYTGSLNISAASLTTALFTNTTTTSPTQGAGMQGFADDGAAMNNGDRLGYYTLGGAYNATHSTFNAVALSGFTTEAWTATAHGSEARIEVTPAGTATRSARVIVTASNGVKMVGTTTNDNAAAGYIGEYITSSVPRATPVALTSGVAANVTSISLTPGDWVVQAMGGYVLTTTTSVNYIAAGSSKTSAAFDSDFSLEELSIPFTPNPANDSHLTAPMTRYSLAATTTIYLVVQCNFGASTCGGYGVINAWRVR